MKVCEAGFVRVKVGGIHLYSCYAPLSLRLDEFEELLGRLSRDVRGRCPVAIAGDFNAWAVEWGSRVTNAKGRALSEAITSLDFVLLNSGNSPTFCRGEASLIVDLNLVSSGLARDNISWRVTDVYTYSNHSAITLEVHHGRVKDVEDGDPEM